MGAICFHWSYVLKKDQNCINETRDIHILDWSFMLKKGPKLHKGDL